MTAGTQGRLAIGRWIRDRARATPERVAIDFEDRTLAYGELDARSERLASALLERGLVRGDRLATLTANSAEHVVVFFACAKAGFILVPLNWRLSPVELAYQLDDAEPALLLYGPAHATLAAEARAAASEEVGTLGLGGEEQRRLEETGGDASDAPVADEDPLLLVYTSGTTGRPKGALLTHANCFWTNLGFDLATGVSGGDVVLQVLPQFHCGGWNVQPLLAWWKGATVVLEPGFEAARCLDLIARKRVTTMMGVPAVYQFMAQEEGFDGADLSSLHTAVVGGAPMPEAVLDTWRERGIDIVQGYGLTEAAPNVLCLAPEDAARKRGFAGKPYPYVEVALWDGSGRLVPAAGSGELLIRGPNLFAGYWRRPEETAAAFWNGWLLTGDVAERDEEGYYRIVARVKDMYISGGENVYPAEVEGALHEHPAVADAAVVGVPDDRWGESGAAFVVLEPAAEASADELREWCAGRLAKYKVPRDFRFTAELPRSGMGKVLKDELRAAMEKEVVGL